VLELLFSEDFADYRREEISRGAIILSGLLSREDTSKDYIRGAIDMLRMIILIPLNNAKTDEAKETMKVMVARDIGIVETTVLRNQLEREP
jgi:hypothetical protein